MQGWPPARRGDTELMYTIYALKSLSSDRIYIGHTNSIERRLKEHNAGIVRSTKCDRPWELIAIEKAASKSEAMWIERRLKNSHANRNRWLQKHGFCL